MTYSRLREELLMALYQEQSDEGANEIVSFKKLVDEYDLDWKPGWLIEAQKDLREEGLVNGPSNGSNDDMAVGRLTGQGLRYIEEKYGTLKGVGTLLVKKDLDDLVIPVPSADAFAPPNAILTESGDYLVTEKGDHLVTEDGDYRVTEDGNRRVTEDGDNRSVETEAPDVVTSTPEIITSYDSARWTGLTNTVIDTRNAKAVTALIDSALLSLSASSAGNSEIMQAAAYLKAARELTDAPDPPSELIWEMISRAANLTGLLGLFYTLFSQALN